MRKKQNIKLKIRYEGESISSNLVVFIFSFNVFVVEIYFILNMHVFSPYEWSYFIFQSECRWWCHLSNASSDKAIIDQIFRAKKESLIPECDCDFSDAIEESKSWPFYKHMSMRYSEHFETEVNMNISIIKTAMNVYDRGKQRVFHLRRATSHFEWLKLKNHSQRIALSSLK